MGRTMAFATRYEVSAKVDSSTVAERLPAICGSDTFTTVVSSTSMKVLSITATAMIQGLTTGAASGRWFAILFRKHRGLGGEPGPQQMLGVLSGVKDDFDRHPLHDLDIIASCVFGRQDAELLTGRRGDGVHAPVKFSPAKRVHGDVGPLARPHVFELGLLEVGDDPDILPRNDGEERLSERNDLTDLHGFLADPTAHGRFDDGIGQVEFHLFAVGLPLFDTAKGG